MRLRFECANPIRSVRNIARSLRDYVEVLGLANATWGGDDFTLVTRDGPAVLIALG